MATKTLCVYKTFAAFTEKALLVLAQLALKVVTEAINCLLNESGLKIAYAASQATI